MHTISDLILCPQCGHHTLPVGALGSNERLHADENAMLAPILAKHGTNWPAILVARAPMTQLPIHRARDEVVWALALGPLPPGMPRRTWKDIAYIMHRERSTVSTAALRHEQLRLAR